MPEDIYWHNYKTKYRTFPVPMQVDPWITPDMIICIPSCAEPNLLNTLHSINQCDLPEIDIAVIILMNKNESLSPSELNIHQQSLNEVNKWVHDHGKGQISYFVINIDSMPDTKGGVGLARKLAMDEAARILNQDGIIACLDADCIVERNYINEVFKGFKQNPDFEAASIYFEHDLNGLSETTRTNIIHYELHLRYLVHAHRWCGHPFAYHTVGSSMAVKRNAYLIQGGMNTRSAGEDFYFLQKFIEINKLFEIKTTSVYPSARISDRVPFGTGRAMLEMKDRQEPLQTINFESFRSIKPLFESLPQLRQKIAQDEKADYVKLRNEIGLRDELIRYLESIHFLQTVTDIHKNTNSLSSFQKRFFRSFNAFRMIWFTHYMRDHFFPDVPVANAVHELTKHMGVPQSFTHAEALLDYFRKMDKTYNR